MSDEVTVTRQVRVKVARGALVRVVLPALLVVVAAFGARYALGDHLDPQVAMAGLRSIQDRWWIAPAFLVVYIAATATLVPATLFALISGATWGFARGLLINIVALNLAASTHFLVARRLGRARMQRFLARSPFRAFDDHAVEHGLRTVLAVRMLPLPHVMVNVAAGVSAMRWRDFALGSALGALPNLIIYSYFSSALVEGVVGVERQALTRALGAGLLMLALSFAPTAFRKLKSLREDDG